MRKLVLISCFVCAWTLAHAQINLVPNPSFEVYSSCPTGISQLNKAIPWFCPFSGSSDYFHQCGTGGVYVPNNSFGSQLARTGLGYAGIYTFDYNSQNSGRDYIEVQLADTLQFGRKYLVEFYVSLADNLDYSNSSIGACFSISQISTTNLNVLPYIPQAENSIINPLVDKNNWILVSDTIYPQGGELYMTIGNFNVDSVSDTMLVGGMGWAASYYYIDDVSVIDIGPSGITDSNTSLFSFEVFPNPGSGEFAISFKNSLNGMEGIRIQVLNPLSEIIFESEIKEGNGTTYIEADFLSKGIYFIKIGNDALGYSMKKIVIQ